VSATSLVEGDSSPAVASGGSQLLDEGVIAGFFQIVRRAGVVFLVQVLGAALSYAVQVLLARLLGVSGYGLYSYVIVWVGFAALLSGLGLPAASMRFLPVYKATGDWSRIHGFMRTATRATFATAVGMAVVALVGAELLHVLGRLTHTSTLLLAAVLVPAFAGSMLYTEVARAGHRVDVAFIPPLIGRPALISIGVGVFYLSRGSISSSAALAVTFLAAYAVLVCQYVLTRKLFVGPKAAAHVETVPREWFGVGVALLAAGAFTIVLLQVDIVIVGGLLGSRDAGIYAAASKTASLVSFVIMAVNGAATPYFASLWALGRVDELQRLVARLSGVIFWPSLAISAGIAVLSGPLLELFGSGFSAARTSLLVLLVGQVINAAAGSVGYLLTLTGHHREATWALGLSAAACIALAVAGVEAFGLIGAALGSTVGFLLWNASLYWLVRRKLGIRASFFTTRRLARDA
jgi:O-antigen/teichoic acid export membrane protein